MFYLRGSFSVRDGVDREEPRPVWPRDDTTLVVFGLGTCTQSAHLFFSCLCFLCSFCWFSLGYFQRIPACLNLAKGDSGGTAHTWVEQVRPGNLVAMRAKEHCQ